MLLLLLALGAVTRCAAVPYGIPPPNRTQNCQYGISLEWTTRVASSVFATPFIADLMHDGRKEILIPTFSQYLEALNGADGEDVRGYPFAHPKFKAYASPIPVDIDGDGKVEWLVAMYTGELVLFGEEGTARGIFKIPPLAVKKRWMDHRNSSDFSAEDLDRIATVRMKRWRPDKGVLRDIMRARYMKDLFLYPENDEAQNGYVESGGGHVYRPSREQAFSDASPRGAQAAAMGDADENDEVGVNGEREEEEEEGSTDAAGGLRTEEGEEDEDDDEQRRAMDSRDTVQYWQDDDVSFDDDDDFYLVDDNLHSPRRPDIEQQGIGPNGRLSEEAKSSMKLLFHPELYRAKIVYDEEKDAFTTKYLRGAYSTTTLPDEVAVDAHILSTPRIVDIDGGGDLDVIVHVSYYFDQQEYYSPLLQKEPLPSDVDPDNYVATAVVCVNLVTGELKWAYPLHLTTKHDPSPAYALSSPLVVNAEREDASLEVYVTSSTGSIVGLSSDGKLLTGWPVWLGPITASPTAEDLLGHDQLNVCVGDVEGRIRCLTPEGATLWESYVIGGIADHITFGDVNGDGQMDVVFGTSAGLVYALDGSSGATLPHFPIVTGGTIVAPVLLLDLARRSFAPGIDDVGTDSAYPAEAKYPPLSLVVPSHDGKVYIVHGRDGCVETVDIDEKASSMVLTDDLTGNGHMDLLVTTIGGGVYVFETMTPYHPLKVWSSKTKGLNGDSASENNVGVSIASDYRTPRDVRGDRFSLRIHIHDDRPKVLKRREYAVSVYVGTRNRVFRGAFKEAKEYLLHMRAPLERVYSSVTVVMALPNGQLFSDTISLGFNMHFLSTIKYILVIPFVGTACALMLVHKRHEVDMSD